MFWSADKTKTELLRHRNVVLVWPKRSEISKIIVSTLKHSGDRIMLLGCFSSTWIDNLKVKALNIFIFLTKMSVC